MPIPAFVPLAMMGASAIASGIQAISRGSKAKKLEADFDRLDKSLQPVSPEQYAYLNRVRQLERGMRMGTDPTTAMARRGLGQSLAQTQTNIARVGGGPSTVSGLLRAQQGYNVGMGNVAAQAGQQADRMLMFQQPLIDNIQNRIYDLQMKRRNYAQGKAAYMRQAATDSATAAIGALAQGATMIPELNKSLNNTQWATTPVSEKSKILTEQINASLPSDRMMSEATPNTPGMGIGVLTSDQFSNSSPPPSWWTGQAPTWWSQK